MKLLVTGGAGFIGSHIADAALQQGWDVAVLDSLVSGRRDNVPTQARFFHADLRDRDLVAKVFEEFRPTHVSHQAAQASVAVSVREPQMDADVNLIGSINILEQCVALNVRRIVFASTGGAIYGEVPDGTKASVQTIPVPLSPYACSKFAVEKYLECFRHEHGLNYTVLRYANVYGPRQDPHGEAGVVAIFCNRMLAGQSVQINARRETGDDGCVRDYVYVRDVVAANIAACEGNIPDPILNIGTGAETTTRELARTLQSAMGSRVEFVDSGRRAGDVERSVLEVSRLTELLGPPTTLRDGLQQTAAWFVERQTATAS